MDTFIRAVSAMSRAAGVLAALFIAAAVFVIADMVIERYVFNLTTIWQIDVVTYCVVAATFVGSPFVLLTRGHVNVDVLPIYLKPRARFWLAIVANALALAFCLAVFILCTKFWYESYANTWLSNTVWRSRLWIPYLSMPVGLGLICLQYVAELLSIATGRSAPFDLGHQEHGI
jgi:TRAP-type C4-dicarboxylate transport system permease small subunit